MAEKLDKDTVIQKYKDAYRRAHGKEVGIYQSGSWFHIGKGYGSYRLRQLDEMADELNERVSQN